MSVFAIADPHLGFGVNKPMSIFGSRWQDHEDRLAENWRQTIGPEDTTIIPGDISWAMRLDHALPDLRFLHNLPGRKILSRGNHDYWWASLKKMEQFCRENSLESLSFLHNNGLPVPPDKIVCGTRGWILPDDPDFHAADRKIYQREAVRLRLSLEAAATLRKPGQEIIACFHFPPFGGDGKPTLFTDLLEEFSVGRCVFGHVHGLSADTAPRYPAGLVSYHLVAADYVDFKPLQLE
jgi:predicted phosphohydrolase